MILINVNRAPNIINQINTMGNTVSVNNKASVLHVVNIAVKNKESESNKRNKGNE